MAVSNGSFHPNPTLESLFAALDPVNLILSKQNSTNNSSHLIILQLQQLAKTENFVLERGPRYNIYAKLRESKLRARNNPKHEEPESRILTPPRKIIQFQPIVPGLRKPTPSVVAQSVPDFASVLRKENRRPPATPNRLPPVIEMTPPSKGSARFNGIMSKLGGGSKSASAMEKKGGALMARKSYASIEELKGLSSAAANAIAGENNGLRRSGRVVSGYRR